MPNLTKLAENVNVAPLLCEILAHPELWNRDRARTTPGGPHEDVSDIWVRAIDGAGSFGEPHDSVWYQAIKALPSAKSIIFDIMRFAEGERLGGVLITRIPPGKRVAPHVDEGWHARYYDKFAVQLMAAPEQAFCFEGETHVTRAGDIYSFDNSVSHWVTNGSPIDRITMICCIRKERPCLGASQPPL